jgi:signal transduction histidine kinase
MRRTAAVVMSAGTIGSCAPCMTRMGRRPGSTPVPPPARPVDEARTLAPGLELSIHRIVQEALTNVVKHSAAEHCRIVLEYRQDELLLDITDDGPADTADVPAGHGLIGMRERVELHRGRFAAGPLAEGGFRVTARIPLHDGTR